MYDQFGNELTVARETFTYNGTNLVFNVLDYGVRRNNTTTNVVSKNVIRHPQIRGRPHSCCVKII